MSSAAEAGAAPEPFEPRFEAGAIDEMRARLRATRWPAAPARLPGEDGWEWGVDLDYLRTLCAWWADEYDPSGLIERLTAWPSYSRRGIHFLHARSDAGAGQLPVLLIHGWPGAPLEFGKVIGPLLEAGHDVVAPSLPGYGFSHAPAQPLSGSAVADLLAELMAALDYGRYAVQGGDWGSYVAARMAFTRAGSVAALHTNAPGLLPIPADLEQPAMSEAEIEFAQKAQRWRGSRGFHMLVHGLAPDSLGVGLGDSPAALAAWLVPRYREWSDCGGDLESRFSKRDLCDLLSFYWATGTAATALRLYAATRTDRWRLQPSERIEVPAAACDFPGELIRPPREWTERICADLRGWTEMPSGGHFAAWEEPELLAEDLIAFLAGL